MKILHRQQTFIEKVNKTVGQKILQSLSLKFLFLPLSFEVGLQVRHDLQNLLYEVAHRLGSRHLAEGRPSVPEKFKRRRRRRRWCRAV